jgi:ketosteroid isomerase-like protein
MLPAALEDRRCEGRPQRDHAAREAKQARLRNIGRGEFSERSWAHALAARSVRESSGQSRSSTWSRRMAKRATHNSRCFASGDTALTMSGEFTTRHLVELVRRFLEAASRGDFDAMLSFFAPNAVWDTLGGLGTFEGHGAIRGFWDDWYSTYEEFEIRPEEILDLGNGVTFAVLVQKGRPVGSSGEVRHRNAGVATWMNGMIVRVTFYSDVDEGRADAERLAEERGYAVSDANVEIVKRVLGRLNDRDLDGALADVARDAELDWSRSEALDSGIYHGHMGWRKWMAGRWEELSEVNFDPIEVIDASRDMVVTVTRFRGRGRASGVVVEALGAALWTLCGGVVTHLTLYQSRDQALKAVGLADG